MSGTNAAQIEFWNGEVGERWVAFQERMDATMAALTVRALAFADVKPGERVLDIGCGCGATALELAKRVGPTGAVTGVDVSAPMLAHARARAAKAGAKIALVEGDASDYAFEPEYDLVFSRFGVMFFGDPAAAFANIRKALKPGGRLRFVCWGAPALNLWATAPFAAVKDLLPPQDEVDPHAPGPFAFADGARVKDILTRAGYADARLEAFETTMNLGKDVEAALEQSLKMGPLARAIAEADESAKDEVCLRVRTVLEKFRGADGVVVPAQCWLVAAGN